MARGQILEWHLNVLAKDGPLLSQEIGDRGAILVLDPAAPIQTRVRSIPATYRLAQCPSFELKRVVNARKGASLSGGRARQECSRTVGHPRRAVTVRSLGRISNREIRVSPNRQGNANESLIQARSVASISAKLLLVSLLRYSGSTRPTAVGISR